MASHRNSMRRSALPQPTYDFLSAGGAAPSTSRAGTHSSNSSPPRPLRTTLRQPSRPRSGSISAVSVIPTADNEDLRAALKSARYEVESLKQAAEVARLQHQKEVRDAQARADADFKKAQQAEASGKMAAHRQGEASRELAELRDRARKEVAEAERKARTAQERERELREEVQERIADREGVEREWSHRVKDVEKKCEMLQRIANEVKQELEGKSAGLERANESLRRKEADVGDLEAEVLRLRASSGDSEELGTIRARLSEQVEHMRKLEITNREQMQELRNLRQAQRSAAILEEEKRGLQIKLSRLDDVEKELDEAKYQKQMLEDERRAWTAYLQEGSAEGQEPEFDSPEAITRALRNERMEKASLMEQLGAVQPDLVEKEGLIKALEEEKAKMQAELAKAKSGGASATSTSRAQARLERQRALALKEVEYLRAQLKTFEAEQDVTGEIRTEADETARARISSLEDVVSMYREELAKLNDQLSSTEAPSQLSLKRSAPDDDKNEASAAQLGEMSRRLRKLQHELAEVQRERDTLNADKHVLQTQLSALQATARTRVLSLRNNPTDDFEAHKLSTISLLRRENAALQAQLEGRVGSRRKGDVVPAESLEDAKLQIDEAQAMVKSKEKSIERLKQVFNAKSLEMREAIASLLGWNIEFVPNGRFRLTSIFADEGRDGKDKQVERSITFHGEKGTMTIAGGPDGAFGREIRGLIRFWVEERNEIPGFLAAYTMENLEREQEAKDREG